MATSGLPPVGARVAAFAAIVVGGACGGLIGAAVVRLQCHQRCSTPTGVGALIGAVVASLGVAIVSVLALRAMGEWRTIQDTRSEPPSRRQGGTRPG